MDPAGIAYSLDQLMELAGLAVAQATAAVFPLTKAPSSPSILVLAGPGNNGGDGLVAARHLALWGYPVSVCYPRRPASQPHYARLVAQLEAAGVPFVGEAEAEAGVRAAGVVVDALLGFGARGRPRPPLAALVDALRPSASPPPIVAVDIPSGWGVDEEEEGEAGHDDPRPTVLVSLTAPKHCAARFGGAHHYVGGRFIPPALAAKYGLALPVYPADGAQVVRVGGSGAAAAGGAAAATTGAAVAGEAAAAAPAAAGLDVAAMRADYGDPSSSALPDPAASGDPLAVFAAWFAVAVESGAAEEPNAMVVATSDPATGAPSARFVLLKGYDARGFQFYTNLRSRKAKELVPPTPAAPPRRAALVFYWECLKRSVRVEGPVEAVPAAEADAYFASRPRGSQVGAHASRQSSPLEGGRAELEAAVAAAGAAFADPSQPIPRPPSWGGFLVRPDRFEFWAGASSRLHDRVVYEKAEEGGGGWKVSRLAP